MNKDIHNLLTELLQAEEIKKYNNTVETLDNLIAILIDAQVTIQEHIKVGETLKLELQLK